MYVLETLGKKNWKKRGGKNQSWNPQVLINAIFELCELRRISWSFFLRFSRHHQVIIYERMIIKKIYQERPIKEHCYWLQRSSAFCIVLYTKLQESLCVKIYPNYRFLDLSTFWYMKELQTQSTTWADGSAIRLGSLVKKKERKKKAF